MDLLGRGVPLPLVAFLNGGFMQVPIISSGQLDQVPGPIRLCERIATDTACINQVRLLQAILNTSMLREVAIRQMHIRKQRLSLLVDAPANEVHLGRITKTARCALNFVFLMRSMNEFMAGLAEGNQVPWAVAACLSTLNMMHTEDRIVRFSMTPLASMPVPKEHILPYIPEAQLWAFLIRFALDLRMAELLKIKLRDFDNGSANGQELVNEPD